MFRLSEAVLNEGVYLQVVALLIVNCSLYCCSMYTDCDSLLQGQSSPGLVQADPVCVCVCVHACVCVCVHACVCACMRVCVRMVRLECFTKGDNSVFIDSDSFSISMSSRFVLCQKICTLLPLH